MTKCYQETVEIETQYGEKRTFDMKFVTSQDVLVFRELMKYLTQKSLEQESQKKALQEQVNTLQALNEALQEMIRPFQKRTCQNPDCQKEFIPRKEDHYFHSEQCRHNYYNRRRKKHRENTDTQTVSNNSENPTEFNELTDTVSVSS